MGRNGRSFRCALVMLVDTVSAGMNEERRFVCDVPRMSSVRDAWFTGEKEVIIILGLILLNACVRRAARQ